MTPRVAGRREETLCSLSGRGELGYASRMIVKLLITSIASQLLNKVKLNVFFAHASQYLRLQRESAVNSKRITAAEVRRFSAPLQCLLPYSIKCGEARYCVAKLSSVDNQECRCFVEGVCSSRTVSRTGCTRRQRIFFEVALPRTNTGKAFQVPSWFSRVSLNANLKSEAFSGRKLVFFAQLHCLTALVEDVMPRFKIKLRYEGHLLCLLAAAIGPMQKR